MRLRKLDPLDLSGTADGACEAVAGGACKAVGVLTALALLTVEAESPESPATCQSPQYCHTLCSCTSVEERTVPVLRFVRFQCQGNARACVHWDPGLYEF